MLSQQLLSSLRRFLCQLSRDGASSCAVGDAVPGGRQVPDNQAAAVEQVCCCCCCNWLHEWVWSLAHASQGSAGPLRNNNGPPRNKGSVYRGVFDQAGTHPPQQVQRAHTQSQQ